MKARALVAGVLLAVSVGAHDRLAACGDKYLNLGLGTRFERSPAERRTAAILLYVSAGSDLSQALAALSVEAGMKKAGYRPIVAASAAELAAALSAQTWDVIVLDGRDLQAVSQHLPKTAGPHLVPVLTRPAKDDLKQARKTYRTVIDTPSRSRPFVDAVDAALDLHEIEIQASTTAAKRPAR